MEYSDELLHRIWDVEMEILDRIDRVCRYEGLKYSLSYGTMLGAVRHGGFIPWDDDIDIIMPIADYDRLLNLWKCSDSGEFIVQNKLTDEDFTQNFTKIRKNHTTFIQSERERHVSYHTGVFVDIFPGYRVAPGAIGKKLQYAAAAINLLYARDHTSKTGGITAVVERLLLAMPRAFKRRMYRKTERFLRKWDRESGQQWIFPCTIEEARKHYAADLFDSLQDIAFEDRTYLCTADTDMFLTQVYGDYMTPPPEDKRKLQHHPLVVDLTRNADELA